MTPQQLADIRECLEELSEYAVEAMGPYSFTIKSRYGTEIDKKLFTYHKRWMMKAKKLLKELEAQDEVE